MNLPNPLPALASSFYSAIHTDLLPVEYEYRKMLPNGQDSSRLLKKQRRPFEHECHIEVFPQMWGSTALGFGGIGGAAMTQAYTVVVYGPMRDAAVYFSGRLAYHVPKPNDKFRADVAARNMAARPATAYSK